MDAIAKWFAQTYQPSRERIKSEQAQEYNKEAEQKYMDVVREKAKILEIVPEELYLDLKNMKTTYSNYYANVEYTNKAFQGLDKAFANEDEKIMKISKKDSNGYVFSETKDLFEDVKQQRISDYFYNEVQDFSKGGHLETFIKFLGVSGDISYQKLAEQPALSDDDVRQIIAELRGKQVHRPYTYKLDRSLQEFNFKDVQLFIAHPKAYSLDEANELLREKWLKANIDKSDYTDVYTFPSGMGMKEEQIQFRQKLADAYRKLCGADVFEAVRTENGKAYVDILYDLARKNSFDCADKYIELWKEHPDFCIEKIGQLPDKEGVFLLMQAVQLDENRRVADTESNRQLMDVVDKITTPENETAQLLSSCDIKRAAYVSYAFQHNRLKNPRTLLGMLSSEASNVNVLAADIISQSERIDKNILKKVYETVWLYDINVLPEEKLKADYTRLFGGKIEDARDGDGRFKFDILWNGGFTRRLASQYADKLLEIPLDELRPFVKKAIVSVDENLKPKEEYKAYYNVLSRLVDKYGVDKVEAAGLSRYSTADLLSGRYAEGVRNPAELAYLRTHSRSSKLEECMLQNNDTLYTIRDIPSLIKNHEEKVDIILKRDGWKFSSAEEKYTIFNNMVNEGKYYQELYAPYIEKMIANTDFRPEEAAKYSDYSAGNMLKFVLYEYGKNPVFDKKALDFAYNQAKQANAIGDEDADKLAALGYSMKYKFPRELISYGEHRNASFYLDTDDLDKYDFEQKFKLEFSYHPSSHSHTTFLNEALQYKCAEAAVTALNYGASPFTKAGFAMDKFQAMPFAMMFNRALKNNETRQLEEFMGNIASHIKKERIGVFRDIWTSLGQKLCSDVRVKRIISNTDEILRQRDPSYGKSNNQPAISRTKDEFKRSDKQSAISRTEDEFNRRMQEKLRQRNEQNDKGKSEAEKIKEMRLIIQEKIAEREAEAKSSLSPTETGTLIQEMFKSDEAAKPYVLDIIKAFQKEAKEKQSAQAEAARQEKKTGDKGQKNKKNFATLAELKKRFKDR